MDKDAVLLIVAAGKSSRFGGFPKAFCQIGKRTNVDNTIEVAERYFDEIYLGVNRHTYKKYNNCIKGCKMFSIVMGQGDAHSLLKCLIYVRKNKPLVKRVVVCWGDAFFVDSSPFETLLGYMDARKVVVACSLDDKPYAWFDINKDNEIMRAHFASKDGIVNKGVHDQSLFGFDIEYAIEYLTGYMNCLGIKMDNDEDKADKNEMKLLESFKFLFENRKEKAYATIIPPGKVLAFNTKDELEDIISKFGY